MKKTPAPTAKRLLSPRQYRALRELLTGPRSVRQLFDKVGCNGVPQLISALKAKGLVIHNVERTGFDRDGRKIHYGVYRIDLCSVNLAAEMVEAYEQHERAA